MRRLWAHPRGQRPLLGLRILRLGSRGLAQVVLAQVCRCLIPVACATLDLIDRLPRVEGIPNIPAELVPPARFLRAPLRLRLVEGVVDDAEAEDRAFASLTPRDLLIRPRAKPARVLGEVQVVRGPCRLAQFRLVRLALLGGFPLRRIGFNRNSRSRLLTLQDRVKKAHGSSRFASRLPVLATVPASVARPSAPTTTPTPAIHAGTSRVVSLVRGTHSSPSHS